MLAQTIYVRDPRVQRAAEALVDAGYDVDVFTMRDRGEAKTERIRGVAVHRLPISRLRGTRLRYVFEYAAFFALCFVRLSIASYPRRYAAVYVHTLPDALLFAAVVPRALGARLVLDLHDPMPEMFVSKYRLTFRHPTVRVLIWLESAAIRFADAVITVHEPLRDLFVKRGCPPEKIRIVMNLTDLSAVAWSEVSAQRTFASRRPLVLIYTGTLSRAYGVDIAVNAVATVHHRIPGAVRMRVVGEGPELPQLRALVASLGITDLVSFDHPVPHDQILSELATADIGLAPNRRDALFELSLSNKVYEYVAAGLPTIASRTSAIERYYPPDTVVQVPPGDESELTNALISLATSVGERRRRSDRGRQLIARWNWVTEREKLVSLLDTLVQTRVGEVPNPIEPAAPVNPERECPAATNGSL